MGIAKPVVPLQTMDTISNFFDNCTSLEITLTLSQMKDAALAAHHTTFDDADNRRYMLWFCREVIEVLEAVREVYKPPSELVSA